LKSRSTLVLAVLSLLGLALIVSGIVAAQSGLHSIALSTNQSFDWRVSGYIEFKAISDGTINTEAGSITVKMGDMVRIVVDSVNTGNILINRNGQVDIRNLRVEAIYVNEVPAASSTVITSTSNLLCDVGSVNSTLRLEVTLKQEASSGQASLTIDGQEYVKTNKYRYIIVYGITVTSDEGLNLNNGGNKFSGAAAGVEFVDSSGSVQVIGVPEAEVWGFAAAVSLIAALVLYSRRYSWLKS